MARMTRLKEVGVIRSGISTGKSARTIRMNRALILSPGCIAKVVARRPRFYYMGHVLMENRHGLVVDGDLTEASGTAERDTAVDMLAERPGTQRITVGGDKLYDTKGFVAELRQLRATPHVAQNDTNRRSAIDARTTRHSGYDVSQRVRKRIEEIFGWGKDVGPIRKTKFRGKDRVGFQLLLTLAGYNLIRMRNILAEVPT